MTTWGSLCEEGTAQACGSEGVRGGDEVLKIGLELANQRRRKGG